MAKIPDPKVRAIAALADRMVRDMEGHPFALRMQAEVNRLRNGAEALDRVVANRSPLDTPSAHALKVAKMARQLDGEICGTINRLGAIAREGVQDVQRRIDMKVDLKPDSFASEIRAAFRSLDCAEKAKLINRLVKENRGPELAAIVKAPSVLTGITDEQRAAYEKSMLSTHAGAEVDENARLEEVFGSAMTACGTTGRYCTSLIDPGKLAEIERGASAADEAGNAFNQSLQ